MMNRRIIIIDDDEEIWESYRSVLVINRTPSASSRMMTELLSTEAAEDPFQVDFDLAYAQQGETGFRMVKDSIAKGKPFSIAFIDIRMPPGWGGVDTARAIRQIDENIEIVIVTAFSDLSQMEIVRTIGVPDKLLYMRKPFDAEELAQVALSLNQKWNISWHEQQQKTEINLLVKELQQTRNYLDSIIDSMPSIIAGVDEQGLVTHWNQQAEKMTNIPFAQAKGMQIESVFPKLVGLTQQIQLAIHQSEVQRRERIKCEWRDTDLLIDVIVYPLSIEGLKGAVVRVDDVTQRVRMEEVMVQSDKMISVGGLAAGVAHEINTPLGSILQNAQLLELRTLPNDGKNRQVALDCGTEIEKISQYMEQRGLNKLIAGIRDAGGRTSKIVKSMLAFSHQSASKTKADLAELVEEVILLAKSDFDLKKRYKIDNFEFVRQIATDVALLTCEKTKIEQVLLNLIRNAAQAMEEMPKEHKPKISIRIRNEESHVRIEVEDNGPGLDEKIRKRVFEPFFTTKAVGVGTGLGLSLAYFIISESHKGKIAVESELGQGTTFVIQIPVETK